MSGRRFDPKHPHQGMSDVAIPPPDPPDKQKRCPTCGCPDPKHLNHGRSPSQGPCPDPFHADPPDKQEGERWTIEICGNCRRPIDGTDADGCCDYCGEWLGGEEPLENGERIEVVPASALAASEAKLAAIDGDKVDMAEHIVRLQAQVAASEARAEKLNGWWEDACASRDAWKAERDTALAALRELVEASENMADRWTIGRQNRLWAHFAVKSVRKAIAKARALLDKEPDDAK